MCDVCVAFVCVCLCSLCDICCVKMCVCVVHVCECSCCVTTNRVVNVLLRRKSVRVCVCVRKNVYVCCVCCVL